MGFAIINENNDCLQSLGRIEARRGALLIGATGLVEGVPDEIYVQVGFNSLAALQTFITELGIPK